MWVAWRECSYAHLYLTLNRPFAQESNTVTRVRHLSDTGYSVAFMHTFRVWRQCVFGVWGHSIRLQLSRNLGLIRNLGVFHNRSLSIEVQRRGARSVEYCCLGCGIRLLPTQILEVERAAYLFKQLCHLDRLG